MDVKKFQIIALIMLGVILLLTVVTLFAKKQDQFGTTRLEMFGKSIPLGKSKNDTAEKIEVKKDVKTSQLN